MLAFMCASAEKQAHEKASRCAILMVHFGTTFDDTRAVTIDALNVRVREAFPDFTVAEAYTSRIIIDRLKKRGIEKHTPVGLSFLFSVEDGEKTVGILAFKYTAASEGKSHVVMVGHGTSTSANAMYSQVDYMFGAGGYPNIHVATVEGYPTYETTLAKLKVSGAREVALVPFMFVAGDHARNDIAGEWKENLEKAGPN